MRRDLSPKEKLKILKDYDELPKMSQKEAAARLGIPQPTLNKILNSRSQLKECCLSNQNMNKKRNRKGKHELVDRALKLWLENVREKDARVNGPILKTKAEELAKSLGVGNFNSSNGWLSRWLKRENIVYVKPAGEKGEADNVAADSWLKEIWPSLREEYSSSDIFNADETGLYWRALPEHTYVFRSETVSGVKISKDRITILCCASMTGEKSDLLVIGKSKKPRCFKNVKKLPVSYDANTSAWMTSSIFREWLVTWDKELQLIKRKILLLVDNCTAHSDVPSIKNIKVVFLPANTTSIMQPCDQGIIRTFKAHYRHQMRSRIIREMDDGLDLPSNAIAKKITLLDALHMIKESWQNCVTAKTIANCFKKGGFSDSFDLEENVIENENLPDFSDVPAEQLNQWLSLDNNIQTAYRPTEDDICTHIRTENQPATDTASSDDEEEVEQVPSSAEIYKSLSILRKTVQILGENSIEHFKYENYIESLMCNNKKQSKITDYLN